MSEAKKRAAEKAVALIEEKMIVGVGTGSTVNCFIEALAAKAHFIDGAVASSLETEKRLKAMNIPVLDLNVVGRVPLYIDGADECNTYKQLIKGGGGALTREKIIAAASEKFVCIIDASKQVDVLGKFPLPVEVIPMARSFVAREIVILGGQPAYREGFVTDNGIIIIDIHNLTINEPMQLEAKLNNITGVVTNGLFALRGADEVIVG